MNVSLCNSFSTKLSPKWSNEVVEPLDYEEFLSQYRNLIERDSLRSILDFPLNDVDLLTIPKPLRTLEIHCPQDDKDNLPLYIQECLKCYTTDWKFIRFQYRNFSLSSCQKVNKIQFLNALFKQEYEIDLKNDTNTPRYDSDNVSRASVTSTISSKTDSSSTLRSSWTNFDLRSSISDLLINDIFEKSTLDAIDQVNESRRQENRQDALFSLYGFNDNFEHYEKRLQPEAPMEHQGHKILVKCIQLKFEVEIEPIFASMALYDAKERKKISENFYFDLNNEHVKRMLGAHIPYSDVSTISRTAIFDVTYPNPDLFLVIRLEKVLQGDIQECLEPYLKEDKNLEKIKSNIVSVCDRLGKYRQPFAWTAVYMYNIINGINSLEDKDSSISVSSSNSLDRKNTSLSDQIKKKGSDIIQRGSLERRSSEKFSNSVCENFLDTFDNFRPITLTISSFFKQENEKFKDEDLYKFLNEFKRPCSVMKRLKCIPGILKLDLSPCNQKEIKNCLTPELLKINPYVDEKCRPVKEILEFPSHEILKSHYSYRHLLYVNPKEVNFTAKPGSARNIAVKIQLMCGEKESDSLPNIFGKSSCPDFTNEAFTTVNYHNKSPFFYDEIKIKLPTSLNDEHHLLFTFYHISCQKKLEQNIVDTPIGYTWLPLLRDGLLISGELSLPVLLDSPPLNYCYITPEVYLPNTRWLDNHKSVFNVFIETVSSIYPQDKYLMKFWSFYNAIKKGQSPNRIHENQIENEFRNSLIDLKFTKPQIIVKFLPSIFNTLLNLLTEPPILSRKMLNIGQSVFEAMCLILKSLTEYAYKEGNVEIDGYGRIYLVSQYIQYRCILLHPLMKHYNQNIENQTQNNNNNTDSELENIFFRPTIPLDYESSDQRIIHREIALQWVVSSGQTKELAMTYSWFFLELMIRSMCEHLMYTQALIRQRKGRFSEQFIDDITILVHNITSEIISRFTASYKLVNSLNASLAFFIFDLFSIMDRGYVLGLIRSYCKQMNAKITSLPDAANLIELKLEFIQIVCSHEHYLPLNLPFGTPFTMSSAPVSPSFSISSSNSQNSLLSSLTNHERVSSFAELSAEFKQQHYITGLLLSDIFTILNIQNTNLHFKVVNILRNLLSWHDCDPRYVMPDCKMRLAVLYLPLLAILMESLPLLYNWYIDAKDKYFDLNDSFLMDQTLTSSKLYEFNDTFVNSRKSNLNAEVTRHLLISFLWVVKNIGKTIFVQWLSDRSHLQIMQLLRILDISISCFEYQGKNQISKAFQQNLTKTTDIKSKLEEVILGQGSARSELIQRKKAQSTPLGEKLRWKKDYMIFRSGNEVLERPKEEIDSKICIEGNLSTEISFIIVDILENIVQVINNSDPHQSLIGMILKVLIHLCSANQSTTVLPHIFATQRSLVYKFHAVLFDEESEQCADLCLLLLKHCGSIITSNRSQAAASIYLLMKQTFEIGSNFARIKMQITMSLSSLVGTDTNFSENCLRRSLKTILEYAENDDIMEESTFPEQVHDLVFNLHMILSDTVKMKEFQEDPEMLIDLMYRIAKGYQNSPDLRLTWLSNMAQKHMERNNYSEAGMCLIHSAALVAEYLAMLHPLPHLPVGAVTFETVSPNAIYESAVSDDVVNPEQDGFCLGSHFSEAGLCGLLEHAASCFQSAGLYEPMNDIYKILLPISEHNRDFKKLSNIHGKLHDAFSRIDQLHGKRVFGTYFRVGFYGQKFGDLNGEEFVYKEPTLTKLTEIFRRLENFYNERFGVENVVIIKDSNNVDKNSLNDDKAYIQITYVEPYFDPYELRYKQTHFERNYNIKRFIYSTPFTTTGKAHGELHEQYKRKTILTTANHFPYVKTRIKVVDRKQVVLSPIEVAIEDIQKKTQELSAAINQDPPDTKILQMVLQGCIGTTVNQGPLEVALVFLSNVQENRKMIKFQNKLRLCFKDFSKKCLDALKKNKNLIDVSQKEYQRELDRNYKKFTERLQPLIYINPNHIMNGF